MQIELMNGKDFIMNKYSLSRKKQKLKEYFLQAELMTGNNKIVFI